MLVLSRRQQEKIRIGDNVTITVLRMKGKSVRLGIEAPDHVSVLRGELAFDGARRETGVEPVSADEAAGEPQVAQCALPENAEAKCANAGQKSADLSERRWPDDSHPVTRGSLPPGRTCVESSSPGGDGVLMMRVPPYSIGQVLAQFAHTAGPLRPLLDRREGALRGRIPVE